MEVSVVKRRWVSIGCLLVSTVLVVSLVGFGWSLSGDRFKVGETITFEIQDTTTWWWGCCTCAETLVLGWRIVNSAEQVVAFAMLEPHLAASAWQGVWTQLDANAVAVGTGHYKLYVDTSEGTLSRCFTIYDPCACNRCYSLCGDCYVCEDISSITNCACKVSLVFVQDCQIGCFPLFWWGGCCSSATSGCGCP